MKGKLDREEKALLASFEAGEWRPVPGGKELRKRYQRQAQAMFRKDRRVSLRIATPDLEAIQRRAAVEGLPYQTLMGSILHKYAQGRLRES